MCTILQFLTFQDTTDVQISLVSGGLEVLFMAIWLIKVAGKYFIRFSIMLSTLSYGCSTLKSIFFRILYLAEMDSFNHLTTNKHEINMENLETWKKQDIILSAISTDFSPRYQRSVLISRCCHVETSPPISLRHARPRNLLPKNVFIVL